MIVTKVEMSNAEQSREDTAANVTEVVVTKVDGGELVQFGEGSSRNSLDLIVGDIEELDALLVLHRDLGEVGQLVVGRVEYKSIAELIKRILMDVFDNVVRNI